MAAYGAAVRLLRTISNLRFKTSDRPRPIQIFGDAVYTLILFLEENREVKRDFEIQIREAIYEAQDSISSLMSTHLLSPSEAEIRKQSLTEDLCRVVNKFISLAKMTTEEFDHQTLDRKISKSVWKPSDEISSAVNHRLAGRQDDLNQLMDRLMSGSAGLEVIPIVGIPGIGKTAFAGGILDHPLIRGQFDATGLVTISVKYDKRNALLNLLGSLRQRADGRTPAEQLVKYRYNWSALIHQKTNDQLVKHLYDYLKHKRYLILLDDIREVAIWHDLKELFPDYYNRSRILVTRNVDVAPAYPHVLDFMSDEDTLALLVAMVFGDQPCPPHLAVTAGAIARGCRGFPRAIVFVGRLLGFANPIEEYWEIVLSSIDKCGSHVDLMEALILLTYNHLPQQLKVCLLYLAIFPYSYSFRFDDLRLLLLAEGLIEKINTIFDSLNELKDRRFFVGHLKLKGVYFTCFEIAAEVFHEFLARKAKEEQFFVVINKGENCIFGTATFAK